MTTATLTIQTNACRADGCQHQTSLLFCPGHWRLIPLAMRRKIHQVWSPGRNATPAMREAIQAAIRAVRHFEAIGGLLGPDLGGGG